MALQSWGHSHYWSVSSTVSTGGGGPVAEDIYSYPKWAPGPVIIGSLGGTLQAGWEWFTAWRQLQRTAWGCSTEQLHAVTRIADVLQQPIYGIAQQAVRETATKPGMRDQHYWTEVGRVAKAWNWSENVYRRLDANQTADRMLRATNSTCTAMERELAVELAYGAYKEHGR